MLITAFGGAWLFSIVVMEVDMQQSLLVVYDHIV